MNTSFHTVTLIAVFGVLIFGSCKNDDDLEFEEKPRVKPTPEYYPLQTGNYWIYSPYHWSDEEHESDFSFIDSVVVRGDTVIGDHEYSIIEHYSIGATHDYEKFSHSLMLRESFGNIIDSNGDVIFSSTNFTDTLNIFAATAGNDTLALIIYKMHNPERLVTAPAGIFDVLSYRGTIVMSNPLPDIDSIRYTNRFYAPGVGLIRREEYYLASNEKIQKVLLRYHVEQSQFDL